MVEDNKTVFSMSSLHCTVSEIFYFKSVILSVLLIIVFYPSRSQVDNMNPLSMNDAVEIALQNNLLIENARLRIAQSAAKKLSSWDFKPMEFNYKYGQLYSTENDHYFEVTQDFGSLLAHYKNYKKAEIEIDLASTEHELIILNLTSEVKLAYVQWQYMYYKTILLGEEKEYYNVLADMATLRYSTGDISLLEKARTMTTISKIILEYMVATDELTIAGNKLKQLTMTTGNYYPTDPEPQMYIIDKISDTTSYEGNLLNKLYKQRVSLSRANESIEKSKYFPGIHAGYFTQDIGELNNLQGWQAGISFPLWIPKKLADIRQAQIENEIALNNYEYQKTLIKNDIENVLFELNKYFRQIRHYIEYALPESDILINTAIDQLESEEISYDEYLKSISFAYQIKQDYYLILNNYNKTAIHLEIYGH